MIGSTCPNVDGWDDTFEWCEPFRGTPMEQDEPNSEKAGEDSQASKTVMIVMTMKIVNTVKIVIT